MKGRVPVFKCEGVRLFKEVTFRRIFYTVLSVIGLALRAAYVALCGVFVIVLFQISRSIGGVEADDSEHILIGMGVFTGPSGYVPLALLQLAPQRVLESHFFLRYGAFIGGSLMVAFGYWQWFWLAPRVWTRLRGKR